MGINTNKEFDQVFREKLQDFEVMPPESVWASIEASGLGATAAKSSNWRWWAAASVLVLFLSASGYLYFNDEDVDTLNKDQKISQQDDKTEGIPQINAEINNNAIVIEEEQVETQVDLVKANSSEKIIEEELKQEGLEQEDIAFIEDMVFEEEVLIEENDLLVEKEVVIIEPRMDSPEKASIIEAQELSEDAIIYQSIDKPNDNTQATRAGKDFFDDDAIEDITAGHLHDKYWVLGLEFSPEWITVPENNNNNIESYGLDISAKYFFSKWFAETGLGIAFSKDDGVYKVDYQEALFKGSYEDVYNVTFDTTGGMITPTYYTKTVNIYDTIDKVSVEEVKNKYVYLNIPLNIGYSTRLSKRFSFYAKTGLNASFKIYEDIPAPEVSGENTSIIRLTPLYYQRTDWNLQVQLNMGINYHITDEFLFGLEPNARYYVKSLVDGNDAGNPYGLGVKIGFKYILK